jgi:hypothetical protein
VSRTAAVSDQRRSSSWPKPPAANRHPGLAAQRVEPSREWLEVAWICHLARGHVSGPRAADLPHGGGSTVHVRRRLCVRRTSAIPPLKTADSTGPECGCPNGQHDTATR